MYRKLQNFISRTLKRGVQIDKSSSIVGISSSSINDTFFDIANHSEVLIEQGVKINNSTLKISGKSKLILREGTVIENVNFFITNGSVVVIGDHNYIGSFNQPKTHLHINNQSHFSTGDHVILKSTVRCDFNGSLIIGRYTDIGKGCEIRCEHKIEIGEFNLYSYNILIYDTNTHSTDWSERRDLILRGFPHGASELQKPKTSPIKIGDDVWIGNQATILKGAEIGAKCIVGTRVTVGRGKYPDSSIITNSKTVPLSN